MRRDTDVEGLNVPFVTADGQTLWMRIARVQNTELRLPSCWDSKPRCESWEKARELGAVLGNDSAHSLRRLGCGEL